MNRAGSPAAAWSQLHHGIDPDAVPLLGGWLRAMWWAARPFVALRVPPLALTCLGALLALDAVLVADRLPWAALVLVFAAVCCDGLDGAVALLAARATRAGALADRIADRISDSAFAAVLWRCGACWPFALAAGALSLAHEMVRRRRGGRALARITVAERPTRTICTLLGCASAAASDARWPVTVCAAVWAGLAVVGLAQIGRT